MRDLRLGGDDTCDTSGGQGQTAKQQEKPHSGGLGSAVHEGYLEAVEVGPVAVVAKLDGLSGVVECGPVHGEHRALRLELEQPTLFGASRPCNTSDVATSRARDSVAVPAAV